MCVEWKMWRVGDVEGDVRRASESHLHCMCVAFILVCPFSSPLASLGGSRISLVDITEEQLDEDAEHCKGIFSPSLSLSTFVWNFVTFVVMYVGVMYMCCHACRCTCTYVVMHIGVHVLVLSCM